ncbi:MAG: alpha-amylase [Alloprevotella sp.]|nr:alpha-amylase [Alloprevotella sp.]
MRHDESRRILIYQVLPRLYGNTCETCRPDGSLAENGCGKMADFSASRLGRIAAFGFTHIWYTGLLEHATQTDYSAFGIRPDCPDVVKGRAGSPYAVKDYYDIDPDLAVEPARRMEEFEALVERTHRAGLRVVMDFIPNHVARQYHSDACPPGVADLGADDDCCCAFSPRNNFYYIPGEPLHTDALAGATAAYQEFPARATGNDRFTAWPSQDDWYETVKLNYGVDYLVGRTKYFPPLSELSSVPESALPDTWRKMADILLFWAGKGIDAFRCDMAEMVPVEFWNYAIRRVKSQYPEVVFIAEVYNPSEYRNYIYGGGFDYLYDKVGLYDTLRAVVCGWQPATSITRCWQAVDDIRPHMLNFLENHDEQRIASRFFAGDAHRALPALVVSASMGTSPFMVYAGQELGEAAADAEGFSGADGRTSIFDYWSVPSLRKLLRGVRCFTAAEKRLYDYYRRVISLQNAEPALREGSFFDLMYAQPAAASGGGSPGFYAFLRKSEGQAVLVVANFGAEAADVELVIPQHAFDCLKMSPGTKCFRDLLTDGALLEAPFSPEQPFCITLPAHGSRLLAFDEPADAAG